MPGRTPNSLNQGLRNLPPDWNLPEVARQYSGRICPLTATTADARNLEWVTPGHPLFEALRRKQL